MNASRKKRAEFESLVRQEQAAGASYETAFSNVADRRGDLLEGTAPLTASEQRAKKVMDQSGLRSQIANAKAPVEFLNAKQIEASRRWRESIAEIQRQYPTADWDSAWKIASGKFPDLLRAMGQPSSVPKMKPSGALLPAA